MMQNLSPSEENLTAARSSIVDVDTAWEMATFTNLQLLQQAATTILAQANHLPHTPLEGW